VRETDRNGPEAGGALVEFALTAALFLACICVVLDFAVLSYRQAALTKAVHLAARRAVVENPIRAAAMLTWETPTARAALGERCDGSSTCPDVDLACDGGSGDTCADMPGFTALLRDIGRLAPGVDPDHLSVAYRSAGLGFVGRPGGVPLFVTIRVSCVPAGSILYRYVIRRPAGASRCQAKHLRTGVIEAHVTLMGEDLVAN
jgi:hypothetical protein